jgi:short-subunit dehydrogenase
MSNQPVILVTGASSGIGEAVARLFAQRGYRVSLGARRFERLQALAQEIDSAGGQALPVQADLTQLQDIQNLVQSTLDSFDQIDVLFNNAGFGRFNWLENLDPVKDIQAQLQINLIATILVARQVLPHMIQRRSGHIINMVSLGGYVATPTYTIYGASKFGVRGFTEALRREVGVYGIHVSALYPGAVRTEFIQHTGAKRKTGRTTPDSLRLDADQVAQAVLSVVQRPRRGLIIPWQMRVAVWLNVHFPGIADWLIEKRFTRLERDL